MVAFVPRSRAQPVAAGRASRPGSRRCAPRPTCFVAAASARRPIDGSSATRRAPQGREHVARGAPDPRRAIRRVRQPPEARRRDCSLGALRSRGSARRPHRLVQQVDEAEQERDELSARLFEASASKLPEPSTPAVVDLAPRRAADALAHAPRRPRRPHPPRRRAALARRHGQLDRGRVDRAADRRVADPGRASRTPQPSPLPRRHRHCRHCRHRDDRQCGCLPAVRSGGADPDARRPRGCVPAPEPSGRICRAGRGGGPGEGRRDELPRVPAAAPRRGARSRSAKQRLEDAVADAQVGVDPLARARGRHQPRAGRGARRRGHEVRAGTRPVGRRRERDRGAAQRPRRRERAGRSTPAAS